MFRCSLVYCPRVRQVVTLQGEHCTTAVAKWGFVGTVVSDVEAEGRALGAISPAGDSVELPDVSTLRTPFIKWYLTEDMIEGATLPALPWAPGTEPTIPRLRRWIRTRHGMPLMSDANKDALVQAVKDRLQVEADMLARGDRIMLRDPDGRSLQEHLLSRAPAYQHWHFQESTRDSLQLPCDGWVSNLQDIAAVCPSVDKLLLFSHWEHRLQGHVSSRTILDDAVSRVSEVLLLHNFAYHPNEEAALPRTSHGGQQGSCYFRFSAPASQRMEATYNVWVELSVCKLTGSHPFCGKVIRSHCTCPIGSSSSCAHLAMLLIVINRLPRPLALGVEPPCTSKPCAWLRPGGGGDIWCDHPTAIHPLHEGEDGCYKGGRWQQKGDASFI